MDCWGWRERLCDTHQSPTHHPSFPFSLTSLTQAWLDLDPSHAAFVFCSNGKTRTGIVIACLLRYFGRVDRALDGFSNFLLKRCQVRSVPTLGLFVPTNTHVRRGGREGWRDGWMDMLIPPPIFIFKKSPSDPPSNRSHRFAPKHPKTHITSTDDITQPAKHTRQAPLEEVLPNMPPTLVQFFRYFDDVLLHRHFPNRFPLVLDKASSARVGLVLGGDVCVIMHEEDELMGPRAVPVFHTLTPQPTRTHTHRCGWRRCRWRTCPASTSGMRPTRRSTPGACVE